MKTSQKIEKSKKLTTNEETSLTFKKKKKKKRRPIEAPLRKEPVRIRQKVLKNGNMSLFLDTYWEGEREYDFLKLYLVVPLSEEDRQQNQNTYKVAELVRAQRVLDLQSGKYKIKNPNKDASFIEYMQKEIKKRINGPAGNSGNWKAALMHLQIYTKGKDITFGKIDASWLNGFKEYLTKTAVKEQGNFIKKKIKPNTQNSYFNKIKAALENAFVEGIIQEQTGKRVKSPKAGEGKIEFLEWSEVQSLARTECESPLIKRAFLFSVLSGLRWSDIKKLKWSEIRGNENDGYFIDFSQKKTDGFSVLPFPNQGMTLLGKRGLHEELIFDGLKYGTSQNMLILRWMCKGGIFRHITFHVARHTYATQLLAHGVDIYVVSKMLGHKRIQTTEVYAKVVIQLKVQAARSLPLLNFNNANSVALPKFTNSDADIAMLAAWLNDNSITVSSLMTMLSNTKAMVGKHTQQMLSQAEVDTRPLPGVHVVNAVNFVTSLTLTA